MIHTLAYRDLANHFKLLQTKKLADLFAEDKLRFAKFHLNINNFICDFSKNNITEDTLNKLVNLAKERGVGEQISAMFSGDKINSTEHKAALHTALRSPNRQLIVDGHNVSADIQQALAKIKSFSDKVRTGEYRGYTDQVITDIVNVGIGGSDLGVVLLAQALKPYCQVPLKIHCISSVDGYEIFDILSQLDPASTLFIIASKTFTTQETMCNALTIRKWFLAKTNHNVAAIKQHFVAVSTNATAAREFGIDMQNMFPLWNFVGGRYSIWGAVGLPIALYIGFENFSQFLAGASDMDEHFTSEHDFRQNLPVILALIGIWYINFYDYTTLVISPYNTRLSTIPAYLQQLEMESNGKSVDKNGQTLQYKSAPVIWGGSGINGQHAYYQLLHQGTSIYPMDIILAMSTQYTNPEHQDTLVANAFAQAEALMLGKTESLATDSSTSTTDNLARHKAFTGNRPTNMLLLPEISPYYLGMLLALYEHKTFVQGVIWGVNSFDQWGVELGKELAKTILAEIEQGQLTNHDDSTNNLLNLYKAQKQHELDDKGR